MATTASGATASDHEVHRNVCLAAQPGESWADLCECGELRVRHRDASHAAIPTVTGGTCTGRNLAGACRNDNCSCTRFALKEARRD
jgi:hypothetical protein